jgi:hypothetical protein
MSRPDLATSLLGAITAAELTGDPWPHAYLAEALPAEVALRLSRSFDQFAMESFEETERAKTYRLRTARLDGADRLPSDDWASVVELLTGPDYRAAISDLTGVPLGGGGVGVDVWEYRSSDWLAPHVDKPDKLVTQIFYLTQRWDEGDGGRLLIQDSADPTTARRALPPVLGSSAVLVRSESSWHSVEAPGPSAAGRRSITATFRRGTGTTR